MEKKTYEMLVAEHAPQIEEIFPWDLLNELFVAKLLQAQLGPDVSSAA